MPSNFTIRNITDLYAQHEIQHPFGALDAHESNVLSESLTFRYFLESFYNLIICFGHIYDTTRNKHNLQAYTWNQTIQAKLKYIKKIENL